MFHFSSSFQSEAETAAYARRLQLAEEELDRTTDRLNVTTEKLEVAEKKCDELERWVTATSNLQMKI